MSYAVAEIDAFGFALKTKSIVSVLAEQPNKVDNVAYNEDVVDTSLVALLSLSLHKYHKRS